MQESDFIVSDPFTSGPGFGAESTAGRSSFGGPPQGNQFGGSYRNDPNQRSGFGGPAPAEDLTPVGPVTYVAGPWTPVIIAATFTVIGLILGLIVLVGPFSATDNIYLVLALIGWALSGVIAFVFLGEYLRQDNKLRAEHPYIGNGTQVLLYKGTIALGFLGVILTAVEIALWFSKL